ICRDLLLQLRDLLPCIRERVGLAVKRFHAMTTDTAALIEQILREIQLVSTLRHAVIGVTHLAAGLSVLFGKERVKPERIKTVALLNARSRASVAAVTGRATELFRIVN